MKIYFEDGMLVTSSYLPLHTNHYYTIDAKYGVASTMASLDTLRECEPDAIVYTNSILALSNVYAWNEELKVPEVYIRAGEHMEFTRIDKLTERELRYAHNLAKMYVTGLFDNSMKE